MRHILNIHAGCDIDSIPFKVPFSSGFCDNHIQLVIDLTLYAAMCLPTLCYGTMKAIAIYTW